MIQEEKKIPHKSFLADVKMPSRLEVEKKFKPR